MLVNNEFSYTPTKKKLLDAALGLMLSKGYTATKVDEICQKAKVTKGGFFHYFKSKEDIGKETLIYFSSLLENMIANAKLGSIEDPWERVDAFLDLFILIGKEKDEPQSCLAGNLAQELFHINPEIMSLCDQYFAYIRNTLQQFLEELRVDRSAQAEVINTRSLADLFVSIFQGSIIVGKVQQNNDAYLQNIEHYRSYLRFLFSH